jgi:hypothetical protein
MKTYPKHSMRGKIPKSSQVCAVSFANMPREPAELKWTTVDTSAGTAVVYYIEPELKTILQDATVVVEESLCYCDGGYCDCA